MELLSTRASSLLQDCALPSALQLYAASETFVYVVLALAQHSRVRILNGEVQSLAPGKSNPTLESQSQIHSQKHRMRGVVGDNIRRFTVNLTLTLKSGFALSAAPLVKVKAKLPVKNAVCSRTQPNSCESRRKISHDQHTRVCQTIVFGFWP